MRKKFVALAVIAAGVVLFLNASRITPKNDEIVVSIKPIHSLVCALTKGITHPKLLLDGNFSPHHVRLVPSQIQAMQNARAFIWIGSAYEHPLGNYVKKLEGKIITIQDSPLIKLKPLRNGLLWDEKAGCNHAHDDDHHHHHHHHHAEGNLDGHIWLDPMMMVQVVGCVLNDLKSLYPNHHNLLERNAKAYKERLQVLYDDLLLKMELYKGQTYIIQHDGNQYFDAAFGTQTIATISIEPGVPPSAGHIMKIRKAMSIGEITPRCLFAERQMEGNLAKSYASTLKLPFAILDYLAADIPSGEIAYEQLMHDYITTFIGGIKNH